MGLPISTFRSLGAMCFFEWATVHVLAFFLMAPTALKNDIGSFYVPALVELAPEKDQSDIQKAVYPKWIGRPLFQHSFNLGWTGCFSYLAAYYLMEDVVNPALPIISLVPWLTDFGYFMAIDVPELGGVGAQAQTYIITTACICGAIVAADQHDTSKDTLHLQIAGFATLAGSAILNKLSWKLGLRKRNPTGFA